MSQRYIFDAIYRARFSPFEGPISYKCSRLRSLITTRLSNPLFQIIQKEKIATKIAVKISLVNGDFDGLRW